MKRYDWRCLACDAANGASLDACARCGCPSHATSAQIDAAREALRSRSGAPRASTGSSALDVVAQLPLLLIGAAGLLVLGGLMLIVATGVSALAFGGLLIALAALCATSHRTRPPAV